MHSSHPALQHHFDSLEQQREASSFGMWTFLVTEILFFGGLFTTYVIYRTRFHGVFAPNSRHRALVTPAKRGRGNKVRVADEPATPAQRRASMTWAQRLKRVFNIDIETCSGCGGAMKVIACIEDPIVIKQILDHLKHKAETSGTRALPESRAPPAELLLGLFD